MSHDLLAPSRSPRRTEQGSTIASTKAYNLPPIRFGFNLRRFVSACNAIEGILDPLSAISMEFSTLLSSRRKQGVEKYHRQKPEAAAGLRTAIQSCLEWCACN
jgi:hypothetical protein